MSLLCTFLIVVYIPNEFVVMKLISIQFSTTTTRCRELNGNQFRRVQFNKKNGEQKKTKQKKQLTPEIPSIIQILTLSDFLLLN